MAHQGTQFKWLHVRHLQLDEPIHGWWCPYRSQSPMVLIEFSACPPLPSGEGHVSYLFPSNLLERLQARYELLLWDSEGRVKAAANCRAHIKKTLRVTARCLNISGFQLMSAGGNFMALWLKSLGMKRIGSYGEIKGLSHSPSSWYEVCLFIFVLNPYTAQAHLHLWQLLHFSLWY